MTAEAVHTGTEYLEIWRQPDDAWRWRYLGVDHVGDPLEIVSNRAFSTWDEARAAAVTAYPGVPVGTRVRAADLVRNLLAAAAVVTVAVLIAVVVVRRRRAVRDGDGRKVTSAAGPGARLQSRRRR